MKTVRKPARIRRQRHSGESRVDPSGEVSGRRAHTHRDRRHKASPVRPSVDQTGVAPLGPLGWLKLNRFCELSGYTEYAVRSKISQGKWKEGVIWMKACDGRIHINWEAYQAWVQEKA